MAEPVKIKFEYRDPENVKAEVPGAQNIREAPPSGDEKTSNNENIAESSQKNAKNGNVDPEAEGNEVIKRDDHSHVTSRKRIGIHGEPVMMDKLDNKMTKTKIPIARFRQTVEQVQDERRSAREKHESHIPVGRSSIPKPVKEIKTPPNNAEKEITVTKTVTKNHLSEPIATKTIIEKEITEQVTSKSYAEASQSNAGRETCEPEDEFDKIYAEIVTDSPTEVVFDDSLLDTKLEDPEKLDSKFEEIIHDYDEHKLEPINPEVVRRTKLPVLRRKSQQEIQLNSQTERTSKIIAARDKIRLRHSTDKDENFEMALDEELKKVEANNDFNKHKCKISSLEFDTKIKSENEDEVTSTPNSKIEIIGQFTKIISTSTSNEQENIASPSHVQNTAINEEPTNESIEKNINKQYYIAEDNIIKDSIQIGIPVFDSYIHEYSETSKNEELSTINQISETTKEFSFSGTKTDETNEFDTNIKFLVSKTTNDFKSNSETADSDFKCHLPKSKNIESTSEKVQSLKPLYLNNNEVKKLVGVNEIQKNDDVQIRTKTFAKTESKEVIEIERNQRESINELRKKKSVVSKIAMFERKPEESVFIKAPKKQTKLPRLITKDQQKVEHIHVHTPLIVDEVFKTLQMDISLIDTGNENETPLINDENITVVRTERVTVKSPDAVHYAIENKVQIETKPDVQTKEDKIDILFSQADNKTVYKKAMEVDPNQDILGTEVTAQKVEIATIIDVPTQESIIANTSPKPNTNNEYEQVKNKTVVSLRNSRDLSRTYDLGSSGINSNIFDFNEASIKNLSPTRLSFTKELQSPIVIPGFKPVRELLKSYESKQETNNTYIKKGTSKVENKTVVNTLQVPEIAEIISAENQEITTQILHTGTHNSEKYGDSDIVNDYKSLDDVFTTDNDIIKTKSREDDNLKREKSPAELDLGDAVKGKVNNLISRMYSVDRTEVERREVINKKEMPRKRSVSEKIALFEVKMKIKNYSEF